MNLSKFDMLGCLSVVYFLNRGLRTYETADLGHPTGLPTVGASFGHILGGKKVSGQLSFNCYTALLDKDLKVLLYS